mmetsp:Transcript_12907/g.39712  ORF Transcript_12907/g.39712 Transcript_12907/m.39712 type:complete len:290 (-) Transcript_12907:180-1049(-)
MRRLFESGIKRPYFHVESLDSYELQNWRSYLDFEEREGTYESTVALYERCLVTTCLYAEFWTRYSRYLEEKQKNAEKAKEVLERATNIYCKRGVPLFQEKAAFEERHGNLDEARRAFGRAIALAPALVELHIKRIQMEIRAKQLPVARDLYEKALKGLEEDANASAYVFVHYARFLNHFLNDQEDAKAVYVRGLEKLPSSMSILRSYIAYTAATKGDDIYEKVAQIYEDAVGNESKFSENDRTELFRMYVEFAADFAKDIKTVEAVNARHQSLIDKSRGEANKTDNKPS